MALIKCKECGNEISNKADNCPNCGFPLNKKAGKKQPKQYGCGTLILLGFVGLFIYSLFTIDDTSSSKPKISDTECKKTLQCWGDRHNVSASVYCQQYVEKLAKYQHKWTDGVLEPKFSHFVWKNQANGIVTFIGDKIQFQNGFGAFQNHVYRCDFNPATNNVLNVTAEPGRL